MGRWARRGGSDWEEMLQSVHYGVARRGEVRLALHSLMCEPDPEAGEPRFWGQTLPALSPSPTTCCYKTLGKLLDHPCLGFLACKSRHGSSLLLGLSTQVYVKCLGHTKLSLKLTFLSLNFLLCKIRIIVLFIYGPTVRIKSKKEHKGLGQMTHL